MGTVYPKPSFNRGSDNLKNLRYLLGLIPNWSSP